MSELLAKIARAGKQRDKPDEKPLAKDEQRALDKLRAEAKKAGATLATGGKGGLPPSTVLGIMRRDDYECKACGTKKDLSIHHKGGDTRSKWLSNKGHRMDRNNLVTICTSCHDKVHEKAREDGTDSSQVKPEGDKH